MNLILMILEITDYRLMCHGGTTTLMCQRCRYVVVGGGPQGLLGNTSKTPPSIQRVDLRNQVMRRIAKVTVY